MPKTAAIHTEIVQEGNPVLRAIAKPVPLSDIGTKKLNDIIAAMNIALEREADGVAIAAPQIGVPLRIFIVSKNAFVIDEEQKERRKAKSGSGTQEEFPATNMVVINPKIIKLSRKKVKVPEGCLSVRWLYGNTMRHEKATIRAYDEHGKAFTYGGSGLMAQIFQHETDHLDGTLFIDHASDIEKLTPEEITKAKAEMKSHNK